MLWFVRTPPATAQCLLILFVSSLEHVAKAVPVGERYMTAMYFAITVGAPEAAESVE